MRIGELTFFYSSSIGIPPTSGTVLPGEKSLVFF